MYNFQPKHVYSFDVYPSALLGTGFKKVTVLGVVDYETALSMIDAETQHNQFRTYLPAGSPSKASDYNYVILRMPNGDRTVLGLAWIKDNTVVEVQSTTLTVVIEGQAASDQTRIAAALRQNGISSFTITVS